MPRDRSKFGRLVRLLISLSSGQPYNAGELAAECRCSRRTIYRDLKIIRESGVPIHYDSKSLCYHISRNCPVVLTRLADREVSALAVTCNLSLAPEPILSDSRSAVMKLSGGRSHQCRKRIGRLLNACFLDEEHFRADGTKLPPLVEAIRESHYVRLSYQSRQDSFQTKFAVHQLLASYDGWQVFGRSSWHRQFLYLDVDRITKLELLDETFAPRPRLARTRTNHQLA